MYLKRNSFEYGIRLVLVMSAMFVFAGMAFGQLTITSTLDATPPDASPNYTATTGADQDGRFNRNGVANASSCAVPTPFPGPFALGTLRQYDAYTFTPTADACVTVIYNSTDAVGNIQASAFDENGFNPADLSQNYLAHSGVSTGIPGNPVTFSFNVTSGVPFTIVVNDANATAPPLGYTFDIDVPLNTSSVADLDFDGDGTTDYSVLRDQNPGLRETGSSVRAGSFREWMKMQQDVEIDQSDNLGGLPPAGNTQVWYNHRSSNGTFDIVGLGNLSSDFPTPADFDGDGISDIAIWRGISTGNPSGNAYFFIINSSTNTMTTVDFGQQGDNVTVTGDYDGDQKADPAVLRCPSVEGQCFYYYKGSAGGGTTTYVPWGNGTRFTIFANPGDFDGDGKFDFNIQRENPAQPGKGQFVLLRSSDNGVEYINWGLNTDNIVPGDYDGDGKNDIAIQRNQSGQRTWYILERDGGIQYAIAFGLITDFMTPGDYDGDGKTDIAVWRPNADPDNNYFYVLRSSTGTLGTFEWGQQSDYPPATWRIN